MSIAAKFQARSAVDRRRPRPTKRLRRRNCADPYGAVGRSGLCIHRSPFGVGQTECDGPRLARTDGFALQVSDAAPVGGIRPPAFGEIRRVEIIVTRDADEREEGIAARVGECRFYPTGAPISLIAQTGHSDDSHSPDEWASIVVIRMSPASLSIIVV